MNPPLLLIEKAIRVLSAALFSAAILLNFMNIVGRYVFYSPIFWAEEVMILLVIWAVFLIGFELTLRGAHLKMDMLSAVLPQRYDRIVQAVLSVIGAILAAYVVYHATLVVSMVVRFSQVTAVAEIPKWLLFGSITTGFSLIAVASLMRAVMVMRPHPGAGKDDDNNRPLIC